MTRCKFFCHSVTKQLHWDKSKGIVYSAKFSAVTSGSEENKAFFEATPNGTIEIGQFKANLFSPGKEYYVDIEEAQ